MSRAITTTAPLSSEVVTARQWWGLYMELAKARLTSLVLVTTAVGYLMSYAGSIKLLHITITLLGTALAASCANCLNQCIEINRDQLMKRTVNRPLPSGRISLFHAIAFGVICGISGVTLLAIVINPLTATLAAITIALYLVVYTPMKIYSSLNTIIGALVGAIPPLIGWAAATGQLHGGAWILAAILFVWQIPHFLALAWMYRTDYQAGGFHMLPGDDPTGQTTANMALIYCLALLPTAFTASLIGTTGWLYGAGSLALGIWFAKLGWHFYKSRQDVDAKKLFLTSVMYLPLLLGLMVFDRGTVPSNTLASVNTTVTQTQPNQSLNQNTITIDEQTASLM